MRSSFPAVFAHPDGEALCCGETLARADARGARVSLVGLTRVDPPLARLSSAVRTYGKPRRPPQGRSPGVSRGPAPRVYAVRESGVAVRVEISGYAGRRRRALCARHLQTGPPGTLGNLAEARPEAETSGLDGTRPPVAAGALS